MEGSKDDLNSNVHLKTLIGKPTKDHDPFIQNGINPPQDQNVPKLEADQDTL